MSDLKIGDKSVEDTEPGATANRAFNSDPDGTSVIGQAGWRRETDQTSQRNCPTSRTYHLSVATVGRA
jgi:hypothetical protein